MTTPGYPLGVLSEIVDAYRPDLILLEIRPEAFATGQYEEGPLEMTYIYWCLKEGWSYEVWLRQHEGREVRPV